MQDTDLKNLITNCFLPYAKAFAKTPDVVTVDVVCDDRSVQATLSYSPEDYSALKASQYDTDIGRAFRVVVYWNDERDAAIEIIHL